MGLIRSNKSMCLNMITTEGGLALLVTIKDRKRYSESRLHTFTHSLSAENWSFVQSVCTGRKESCRMGGEKVFPEERGEPLVLRLKCQHALKNRNMVSDVTSVSIMEANQRSNIDRDKLMMRKQAIVVSINSRRSFSIINSNVVEKLACTFFSPIWQLIEDNYFLRLACFLFSPTERVILDSSFL